MGWIRHAQPTHSFDSPRISTQTGKYHGQCGYCGLQVFVRAAGCSRCGVVTHARCAEEIDSKGHLFCYGMPGTRYCIPGLGFTIQCG
jgi:hypothetical protein